MGCMATWRREAAESTGVLVSHTGVRLCRPVAFKFALDVNAEQHEVLLRHAGAARFAYNHHLGLALERRTYGQDRDLASVSLAPTWLR